MIPTALATAFCSRRLARCSWTAAGRGSGHTSGINVYVSIRGAERGRTRNDQATCRRGPGWAGLWKRCCVECCRLLRVVDDAVGCYSRCFIISSESVACWPGIICMKGSVSCVLKRVVLKRPAGEGRQRRGINLSSVVTPTHTKNEAFASDR